MYEVKELECHSSQPSNSICYTCLCRSRKTVPLGEYASIFNRIIFNVEDNLHIKVCWECLAVLKKIKVFEAKCYIAQRILHAKRENRQPPRCLSTLTMTPVKIDVHYGDELSQTHHGFKFEEKQFVYQRSFNTNSVFYENYIQKNKSEDDYCMKFEQIASSEDCIDNQSDNSYKYLNKNKNSNYYLKCNNDKAPNLNDTEVNKCDIVIKSDKEVTNDEECDNEMFNNKFNSSSNSIDSNQEFKCYSNSKSSQFELNKNEKLVRRRGLRKKDLEEHFRIVGAISEETKRFKSKCKIDVSELESWREMERLIDFYVDQPYKCQKCICAFSNPKKKYEHDKKYHDTTSGVYMCDICTSTFASKQQMAAHVSKHYYLHRCNLCQFRCFSRQAMKSHMGRHKRLVMCAHCDACFSNVGLFYKHFKANHSVFICDHCGKRCRTKYTLEKHVRHHSEKNICLICNKVYASRNSLRNHSEMKHKETSSEMAYCVKCDKQFPNVPLYKRHVQTSKAHAAERDADRSKKQVSCPICGNIYSRKTYMMNHYRHVHMKQSKHYCTDCDRHFLNRTRYVEHRKYHHEGETKAKNKMCNICGRGFAANRTLVNHIRTHSGERPYECQYCDAKFTQKHGMLSHIKYIHMKSKRRGFQ